MKSALLLVSLIWAGIWLFSVVAWPDWLLALLLALVAAVIIDLVQP
jgi:hypothetical protein